MKFFTQKIDGYIGNTQWKIRDFGCLGTCFGMILEVDPREIFKHAEYFNSEGILINPQKLCDDFGGKWNPDRGDLGIRPVIVETRFDNSLHFIVWTGDRFYDPLSLDGHPLRDYKIISFRNVIKENMIDPFLPDLENRLWRYEDEQAVNYEFPDEVAFNRYALGKWDSVQVKPNPYAQIEELIKTKGELEKIITGLKHENLFLTESIGGYETRVTADKEEIDGLKVQLAELKVGEITLGGHLQAVWTIIWNRINGIK
jgi:hypothetical protein